MAAKITTTEPFTRQDTFRVAPDDVLTGADSRMVPAPDQDDLDRQRAVSMIYDTQLQPVPVRKDGENKIVTIAGNTRHRAAKLIRSGFSYGGKDYPPDPSFTLWVAVQKMTEDEAFDAGVAENHERHATTDLQEALAHNHYRTRRGLNDSEIARKYNYSNTNRVAALKQLLSRPPEVTKAVHEGKLSLSAANDTASLPPEKLTAFVEKLTAGEKVTGADVRKEARSSEGETVKVFRRSRKDLADFVADMKNVTEEQCRAAKKALFEKLVEWFDGKVGDKSLWNSIDKL